ncbi:acetyltransferase [Rahnella sp. Lac-M11]|uniref:Acetyltransferase n=2 Tax=Rahnella contaminans TaxID=2703882 RepID=A0A6M2BA22_9GAMM|nr:acetyltransferase [Rahnella contaminans]
MGMSNANTTCHLPQWDENGNVFWEGAALQPTDKDVKAILLKPPTKAIPVIFLPGVMGTNLMSTEKFHKAIWRGDDDIETYFSWVKKDGKVRRELLNPDSTDVDDRGKTNKSIYSPISDEGHLFPSRKERKWGEALSFCYGDFLTVLQGALLDDWQRALINGLPGQEGCVKGSGTLSQLLEKKLGTEEPAEAALTRSEIDHFEKFLFPVHVFGYNWLADNAESAKKLVIYIDKVIDTYKHLHGHGVAVEKVVLVTHSMGGLIARYASQILGGQDKILGIVHGVIPDLGSPAAYRRMKIGARQEGAAGIVLGKSATELMPVLARAPAPLQLLPSAKYIDGAPWLTIKGGDEDGSDLILPKTGDPFSEIYLNKTLWWRLYESDIIDKDSAISENNWSEYSDLVSTTVQPFIEELDNTYHSNTYLFYGNEIKSDRSLTWNKTSITYPKNTHEYNKKLPNDHRDIPGSFHKSQMYQLKSSETPGDGTVPVESVSVIRSYNGIKSVLATNVGHQEAYNVDNMADIKNRPSLQFTLRAIAKMVQEVPST